MEEMEIKNTALYRTIECTIKDMLKRNIDDVLDSVMPIFEPFIRERLNQYEEYRKLQVTATAPITLVNNEALEKFQKLPHMNSLYEIQEDWAYTPNLYHFEGEWHVSWIHCSDGDALNDFSGSTPEEAIDKAYNWFHSTFCNG